MARCALAAAALGCVLAHPASAQEPPGPPADTIGAVVAVGEHPYLRLGRFTDYQDDARRLYGARANAPLWVRDGRPTAQASTLLATLADAGARGLNAADYDALRLTEEAARLQAGEPATPGIVGLFDAGLSVAAMRYASDAHLGRVHPRTMGFALDIEPKRLDLVRFLSDLADTEAPTRLLATLDPELPLFGRLRAALTAMRTLAEKAGGATVPDLPKLHPGESDPGVPAVRERLRLFGDLTENGPPPKPATRYDPALAKAVKRFQERHGLGTDAVIGEETLRQLQVPPAARARQIELALERLRWLPVPDQPAFVVVNIPEFRLRAYTHGNAAPQLAMRAVVGSSARRTETPVLYATMTLVIFRPYWTVPPGIARKEIMPDIRADPTYMDRHHMEIANGRLRQRPGPDNALGLIKFIFPNPFHVYMHDTPSKQLFAKPRRDFSHGCIRVSDPVALAEFALSGQGEWDRAKIEETMQHGRNNRHIPLARPIGVYLVYSTATVEDDGTLRFFDDLYGHDARLTAVLEKGPPYPYWKPVTAPTPTPVADGEE